MRNITFFISTVIIYSLILASCNSSKDEKTKVEITILGENSSNLQAMQSIKGEYEKKNNVKISFKPNTFEDAFNKANQDFSTGSGLYDIVMQYNFSLSNFVRNKYVYRIDELSDSLTDKMKDFEVDIFPNAWKEVGYYYTNPNIPNNGVSIIGYPFAANTMLLAYNREMFENDNNKKAFKEKYNKELVVPDTWEDYKLIADFFTNKDENTYGLCMHGATGGWLYYEWCQYLQGFGGKVMDKEFGWMGDENTKIQVNTLAAQNATNYLISLKPYNAGGYTNVDGNEQIAIMKNGNVAMCIIWSDYIRNLLYVGNDKIDYRFGAAPVPGDKSMLAGGAFFINKKSKYPSESFKYIINLMQKENQVKLAKKGLCSPLKSVYDELELQDIPYIPALKTSLERGVYALEAGPDADLINNTITTYMQLVWNNKLEVNEALEQVEKEILIGRKIIFQELLSN